MGNRFVYIRRLRFPVSGAFVPPVIARLAVTFVAFFAVRTALFTEYVVASAAVRGSSFIAVIAQWGVTFFSGTIGYFGSRATAIAPKAVAGFAENKIPLWTLIAVLTNRVPASLASFTSGANKATRCSKIIRARFTKLEVTDAARHVGLSPRALFPVCAHDILVAVITEVQNNFFPKEATFFHTARAVRVFATLALTSFTYDTITTSALAQVEGSLQ